jgi:hypothetical protein
MPHAPPLQIWPLPHDVPSLVFVHDVVLVAGVHTWQPLFAVTPDALYVPLIEQPAAQLPPLQTSPVGQLAEPVTLVQAVVLEAGVQTSQPLFVMAVDA